MGRTGGMDAVELPGRSVVTLNFTSGVVTTHCSGSDFGGALHRSGTTVDATTCDLNTAGCVCVAAPIFFGGIRWDESKFVS